MTDITLSTLTKRFDDVTAVDDLTLHVKDGEFLTVVGPSGCGKSTLLRLLAGLEETTDGTITFGDRDVTNVPASDRGVAMVFQNYALYPHMNAERNMTFGWTPPSAVDADERVTEVAAQLGITDLLNRKPDALSGGEQQRVAIGRALLREPDVLLMDEPLSNLDAKLRVETRAELAELHKELGRTTVYVTHDQTEAMTLGNRVAVLENGKLQQVDAPQDVYDNPVNRFVAEFVGSPSMNILSASLVHEDDGWTANAEGLTISLPNYDGNLSGDVDIGVRPEDFRVVKHSGDATMRVDVTEPLGEALLLRGTIGDTDVAVKTAARAGIAPGDSIELSAAGGRIHLFDPETSEAIYHKDIGDASSGSASVPMSTRE